MLQHLLCDVTGFGQLGLDTKLCKRSGDRIIGTQQRYILPEIFVALRKHPSLTPDRSGVAAHPQTRPGAIEGVERQHFRDGPVAVVCDAQDINPPATAPAVAAGEFRDQRFEGGVNVALFLEGEIGAMLFRYDFQATIAMNAVIAMIDPNRIAPKLNSERTRR